MRKFSGLFALVLTLFVARPAFAAASWHVVPSPNVGTGENYLGAVTAISPNNAWAVGMSALTSGSQTLTEHWNGTSWSVVPSPNAGPGSNNLFAVTAVPNTNQLWAIGNERNGGVGDGLFFFEHYNGTTWSVVPSPTLSGPYTNLSSLAALSTTNVWAVGFDGPSQAQQHTIIEHWNGVRWKIVASPNTSASVNVLNGIVALSPTNMLAVGATSSGQPLVEHYNGHAWSLMPTPLGNGRLVQIIAPSATNIWMYGSVQSSTGTAEIVHFDGTHWSTFVLPLSNSNEQPSLDGIASNSGQLWAVGTDNYSGSALVYHYDGTNWTLTYFNGLFLGVAAPSSTDVWAVGAQGSAATQADITLTEQYS